MSLTDLAVTMALFGVAVVIVTILGFYFFIRWDKREKLRRGRQIALARLDRECAELPNNVEEDNV